MTNAGLATPQTICAVWIGAGEKPTTYAPTALCETQCMRARFRSNHRAQWERLVRLITAVRDTPTDIANVLNYINEQLLDPDYRLELRPEAGA